MDKCNKCNGRLIPCLIDYDKIILGDKITIPNVEGYLCAECGAKLIDESIENRLQVRILEEKLKLIRKIKQKNKAILVNKIKNIRLKKDIPQKKIADALMYTEQRYGAIERNDNTPTIYTIKQLAETIGVNESELYDLVYIPIDVFNKLRNMNDEFQTIEGLQEAREDFEKSDFEYEKVKEEYVKLYKERKKIEKELRVNGENLKKSAIKEHDKRLKEIDKSLAPIEKEKTELKIVRDEKRDIVSDIEKGSQKLKTKGSILKQGYCIEYDDFVKVKKVFKLDLDESKQEKEDTGSVQVEKYDSDIKNIEQEFEDEA